MSGIPGTRSRGVLPAPQPAPQWDSADTPPPYADVADLVENEVDFVLEVRRLQGQPLFVGVSVIDSVLQLKERIHRVQLDAQPESQLIRNKDGKFLPNAMGLGEAGIDADSVVALFIRPEGADVFGPDIGGAGSAAPPADDDEVDGPRLATFKSDEVAEMMLPAPKAFTRAITGTLVPTEGRGDVASGGGSARAGVGAGVGSRRYSEVEGDNTDIEDGLDLENSRNLGDGFASALPGNALKHRGVGGSESGGTNDGAVSASSESDSDSDSSLPPTYSYLDARRGDAPDRTPVTGARKLLLTVLGGLFYIIFASLFVAAPIGMVVVGTQKKEECPSRDRLPTWMVTQGIITIVWVVLWIICKKIKAKMEHVLHLMYGDHLARDDIVRMADAQFQNEQRSLSQIYNLVQGFGLIWFIMGSVWVLGCHECRNPRNASMTGLYAGCDQAAFQLAYWFLLSVYIVTALPIVIFILWVCGFCVFHNQGNAQQTPNIAAGAVDVE